MDFHFVGGFACAFRRRGRVERRVGLFGGALAACRNLIDPALQRGDAVAERFCLGFDASDAAADRRFGTLRFDRPLDLVEPRAEIGRLMLLPDLAPELAVHWSDGGAGADGFDVSVGPAVPSRAGIKSVSQSAARAAAIIDRADQRARDL